MANGNSSSETTAPGVTAMAPCRLVLTWGAHQVEVTEEHPSITVGREETRDIVIKSDKVSRLHARISYRNAHYSLTDQSSNGTFIADSAGKTHKVNRDTYVLMGTGTISFGVDPTTDKPQLFRYEVRS